MGWVPLNRSENCMGIGHPLRCPNPAPVVETCALARLKFNSKQFQLNNCEVGIALAYHASNNTIQQYNLGSIYST